MLHNTQELPATVNILKYDGSREIGTPINDWEVTGELRSEIKPKSSGILKMSSLNYIIHQYLQ